MHSSLLVSYRSARVMIDCGLDWLGKFKRLRPSAIVLTHAHPDHAWGLKNGAPCPVYAPEKTWQTRNPDPLVRPQVRKTSHWACTSSHAADMVQKGRRATRDHHPLRFGDCHRRRARNYPKALRYRHRARPRNMYCPRRDGNHSPIKLMRELAQVCGWTGPARRIEILI